jgi:hypothetical protein
MASHSIKTLSQSTPLRLTPLGVHSGMDITIQNINPSGYIYLGSSNVSTTNYGFRIMPNHSISFELPGSDSLYAVSSDDDLQIAILQTGLESGQ